MYFEVKRASAYIGRHHVRYSGRRLWVDFYRGGAAYELEAVFGPYTIQVSVLYPRTVKARAAALAGGDD